MVGRCCCAMHFVLYFSQELSFAFNKRVVFILFQAMSYIASDIGVTPVSRDIMTIWS